MGTLNNQTNQKHIIKIIYLFFTFSIILISGILPFIIKIPLTEGKESILTAFGSIAVINLFIASFLEKKFSVPTVIRSTVDTQNNALHYSKRLLGAVIGCALRESVAVLGFVLFYMTGDKSWPQIFGFAALIAMIIAWPRSE